MSVEELAEEYATRIVTLRDGEIRSDTDEYMVDEQVLKEPKHKNMGKSSMSFRTALALSFNNLKTKKARTLLTAFAGSIGIIGIALILALANGVNGYIQSIEEETLSEYPLQIQSTGFDITSMMMGNTETGNKGTDTSGKKKKDGVRQVHSDKSFSSIGIGADSGANSMMSRREEGRKNIMNACWY